MASLDRYQSELSRQQSELAISTLKQATSAGLFEYGLACGKMQGLQLAMEVYINQKRVDRISDDAL